jgi:hypothetical protein
MMLPACALTDPLLVRKICKELSVEKDPEKVQDLLSLFRAAIEDDQSELKLKALCLGRRYAFLREKLKH